ncbi:MAG: hypothetical protein V4597_19355 [Pseudomonadota bacterium]
MLNENELGTRAAGIMMRAAVDKTLQGKIPRYQLPREAQDRLLMELRKRSAAALGKALDDAREAAQLGMDDIALATFTATLQLAGIDAAQATLDWMEAGDLADAEAEEYRRAGI